MADQKPQQGLVGNLIGAGYLKTPQVIAAFQYIKRVDFLPSELKSLADSDEALPIGHGQTISQPAVVVFMLELLQTELGHNVLDVGFGSGWTSALLARLVGDKGHVTAVERIAELCDFGKQNIDKYRFVKKGTVQVVCGDGSLGFKTNAPYDRILASASSENVPSAWLEQLKPGGILVEPIGNSIKKFKKDENRKISVQEFEGFVFVPLVQNF